MVEGVRGRVSGRVIRMETVFLLERWIEREGELIWVSVGLLRLVGIEAGCVEVGLIGVGGCWEVRLILIPDLLVWIEREVVAGHGMLVVVCKCGHCRVARTCSQAATSAAVDKCPGL